MLKFGSDGKDSERSVSEKDRGRVGGMAHVCPVREEERIAAANADLWMPAQALCNKQVQTTGRICET